MSRILKLTGWDVCENRLRYLIRILKTRTRKSSNVKQIEALNKILGIVERIRYYNKKNKKGGGLKILTPNQMLSRLPISLAQLNTGNNSEKLKLDKYCILCTVQKNLRKTSIKVWLTLFKDGNNFYEQQK